MTDRQQLRAAVKTRRDAIRLPFDQPRTRFGRGGDLIIGGGLLAFTLPLMAIIALAIKCESPGPVLCGQVRIRAGGRRQVLLKFRTTREPREGDWKRHGQLTRTGHFLRYSHMDELPQLLNLLRGEIRLAELFHG